MAALACLCKPFRVPRRDFSLEECQDAYAADPARGRFAVADGASESAESGPWARLLVDSWVSNEAPAWPDWIGPLRRTWAERADVPDTDALPWFLESRYREGAFSTFLGLWLEEARWKAVAVGDSCLFHVRDSALIASYPLERSSQFDSTPWLIGSRPPPGDPALREAHHFAGSWRPRDRLFLMTDALSCWFLTSAENGEEPWLALEGLLRQDAEAFATWIARLRAGRVLKNDDTTLVAVCL